MKKYLDDRTRWELVRIVESGHGLDVDEQDPTSTVVVEGLHCCELPQSGWGALVGWVAGHDRMLRYPRPPAVITSQREEVDDDIDSYLKDADVPQRPRGYRWFLLLPKGDAVTFWESIYEEAPHSNLMNGPPRLWVDTLAQLVEGLYN